MFDFSSKQEGAGERYIPSYDREEMLKRDVRPPEPTEQQEDREEVTVPIRQGADVVPPQQEFSVFEKPADQQTKAVLPKGKTRMAGNRWMIAGAIVLFVLCVGGGAVYGYFNGYLDIPFLDKYFLSNEVLLKLVDSTDQHTGGEYTMSGSVVMEPKTERAMQLFRSSGNSQPSNTNAAASVALFAEMMGSLPQEMLLEGKMVAFSGNQTAGNAMPDALFSFSGKYVSSGTTFELDAEARTKDDVSYFKINKIPNIFIPFFGLDLSQLTGAWFKVTNEDLDSLSNSEAFRLSDQVDSAFMVSENERLGKTVLRKLVSTNMIMVDRRLKNVRIDGKVFQRFALSIDATKLKQVMQEIFLDEIAYCKASRCVEELTNPNFGDTNTEELQKQLNDAFDAPEMADLLKALSQSIQSTLAIGRGDNGFRLTLESVLAFPESAGDQLQSRQMHATFAVVLAKVNQSPDVQVPENPRSIDDAERRIAGYTQEEWDFKKQTENISKIRTALESYRVANGTYPTSLLALTSQNSGEARDARAQTVKFAQLTIPPGGTFSELYQPLSSIPRDAYSGKEYAYKVSEADYTITYAIVMPEAGGKIYSDTLNQYVDGVNTADKFVVSREAQADLDKDDDGLTGKQELDYHTNPLVADTDGDGWNDFDEIQSKSDPLEATSRPMDTTPIPNQPGERPTVPLGSLLPNTANSNGGKSMKIGFQNAQSDVEVFFGTRQAYVVRIVWDYIEVIVPGTEDEVAVGSQQAVTVTVVNAGQRKDIGLFVYTGAIRFDEDSDGLSDDEETGIGSSVSSADTDHDGTSDYDELQKGSDPLVNEPFDIVPLRKQENTEFFVGNEGTVHFWTRAHDWDLEPYRHMVNFYDADGKERVLIRKGLDYLTFIVYSDSAQYNFVGWSANDTTWVPDEWMHIAITWKVDAVPKLYVNGERLEAYIEEQATTPLRAADVDTARGKGTLYTQGRFSSSTGNTAVEMFTNLPNILTDQEISDIYQKGKQ